MSLRRLLAVLAVVGALLGSGCGADDDGADPPSSVADGGGTGSPAPGDDAGEGGEAGPDPTVDGEEGGDPAGTAPGGGPATEPGGTGSAGEADGADGADPCDLLTGLDLAGLLATAPGEAEGQDELLGTFCVVKAADTANRGQARLVIVTDRATDNYETQQGVFGIDSEVAGLGEAAFHSGPYLFVLEGETMFFLQVVRDTSVGVAVDDADLEAAARQVLLGLGG